eukprot:s1786_g8.t1
MLQQQQQQLGKSKPRSWDNTVVIWAQEMEGHAWRQLAKLSVDGKVEGLSWPGPPTGLGLRIFGLEGLTL